MHRSTFLSLPASRLARSAPLAAGLALAAAVVPAGLASAAPAALPGSCTPSGPTITCTFTTPGTGQSFTVPAGVTGLSVTLYGGVGGTNSQTNPQVYVPGGDGAQVVAALAVSPGEMLGVDVGGAGGSGGVSNPGGVNGGGSSFEGGGGGGATDITAAGTPLLVAGGGGGAGQSTPGFNPSICTSNVGPQGGAGGNADTGGSPGQPTGSGSFSLGSGGGGAPGTTSGPGNGGTAGTVTGTDPCTGTTSNGVAGAAGSGINGGSSIGGEGGGGGGGYFGGGEGGQGATESVTGAFGGWGGGGGGASYTGGAAASPTPVINDTGNTASIGHAGNGEVIITYTNPVTCVVTPYTVTYDGSAHTASGMCTNNVTHADLSSDLVLSGTTHTNASNYSDSWSFHDPNGIYADMSGTVTDTITPAALIITASSGSMTYGGAPPVITPAAYSGFVNGDNASSLTTQPACSTIATSSSPVSTYPSSCSGAADPNYAISYVPGTVTVTPAQLIITASSGSMTYGGAPPAITPAYSGFVNGDNASSLTTQPACSTTATSSSPVSTYPSSCSGAADPNYTISYDPGTVTVNYSFTGFLAPVDNPPAVNMVTAGQSIPIQFSLGGNFGLGIIAAGYPTVQQVSCATGVAVNTSTETDTSGNSGLQYNATTNTYTYVWKTSKASKGTCQVFTLGLNDGTVHTASFQYVN